MLVGARLGSVERRDHLQDDGAGLGGRDPAGVERGAVAGALHVKLDVRVVPSATDEVQVQRLGRLAGVDGVPGGGQRLRGDQPTEQPGAGPRGGLVCDESVTVTVELEQLSDPAHRVAKYFCPSEAIRPNPALTTGASGLNGSASAGFGSTATVHRKRVPVPSGSIA